VLSHLGLGHLALVQNLEEGEPSGSLEEEKHGVELDCSKEKGGEKGCKGEYTLGRGEKVGSRTGFGCK
jgi:hypothetical protein